MVGAGQTQPPTVERNPPRPTQHIVYPSAATEAVYPAAERRYSQGFDYKEYIWLSLN